MWGDVGGAKGHNEDVTERPGYRMFDADQHFYEPRDSFTRYIDPEYRERTLRPVIGPDGVEVMMAGNRRTPHDVKIFDEVGRPGSLREFLLHMKGGGSADDPRLWEPIRREYQDRDARIALMDEQDVEACLMFNNTAM